MLWDTILNHIQILITWFRPEVYFLKPLPRYACRNKKRTWEFDKLVSIQLWETWKNMSSTCAFLLLFCFFSEDFFLGEGMEERRWSKIEKNLNLKATIIGQWGFQQQLLMQLICPGAHPLSKAGCELRTAAQNAPDSAFERFNGSEQIFENIYH